MGINTSFAHLLVRARLQGVEFTDTLTIGRQSLAVPHRELARMAALLGQSGGGALAGDGFAERFLGDLLGARSVRSLDYSDYQQADIVHDLNQPLAPELHNSFDTLIDGGAIEHIFDIRQVLGNYMALVKTGGSIFILTTANNMCGHGFYQFSPEFFYRVFDPANGFETREVVLIESPLLSVERSRHSRYFHANNPAEVGKRIQLVNCRPTTIFVHAAKLSDQPHFSTPPLQSDYADIKWEKKRIGTTAVSSAAPTPDEPFRFLSPWQEYRRRIRQKRKNSHRNKRFFKRLDL
ncbi:MAG: hypothetical protein WBO34_09380 [Gammaproteobacteria bacterium]